MDVNKLWITFAPRSAKTGAVQKLFCAEILHSVKEEIFAGHVHTCLPSHPILPHRSYTGFSLRWPRET
ncbi:uncharacterized protein UV8b_07799 [Ustilaginoidea virens]|uniref:Uncharacterized protein n=1 Tax=Ustilaginoidea virens TaxID=1159556 RepID=A0A8E5HYC6_USTVR|nr:uncharacterized protein UV8b_07799 [Ustilaginoidea virens]QUC23558.1 hypothetical protein UV8b_07799 [Ustilaginoidea virens]